MADDKLRIVATVEDQFTGPLAKLEKGLKGVGEQTSKQASVWKKDWAGVREEVGKFQGVLRGFDPIFSAVGVTGFGAAMSITGMVSALKGFSGQTRDLSNMGRQIGMTVDQLRTLGALGERFGVSADAMRSAVGQFAGNMVDLRQRWGQVYGELRNMNLGKLAEELVNAPNMEAAVEAAMTALQNIPDAMRAARVSTLIFGTADMATVARSITGKIGDALKQTQADIGRLDKQTEEAARRFEEHFSRIGRAAENAKLKVLGPALKNIAGALDQMEAAAADPEGEKLKRLQESRRDADAAAKSAPFGTGWYLERQRDGLDQEIKRMEGRRKDPARTAVEDRLGAAKSELDFYQNRRLVKDPSRERELSDQIRALTEELRRLREQGGGGATFSPSGYGGPSNGSGSLIHKTAWGGFGGGGGAGGGPGGFGGGSSPGGGFGGSGGGSGGGFGGGDGSAPAGGGGAGRTGGARDVPDAPEIGGGMRGRPFGSKGAGGAGGVPGSGVADPPRTFAPRGDIAGRMKGVYDAFRSAGFNHGAAKSLTAEVGRENGYRANLLFGAHRDPYNRKTNAGMFSWQGSRGTALLAHLRDRGLLNPDGSIKRSQESLNAQAEFAKREMEDPRILRRGRHALDVLNDPNSTHAQRALTLGDDVIKWRQHDPRYAHHKGYRDRYYGQIGALTDGALAGASSNPRRRAEAPADPSDERRRPEDGFFPNGAPRVLKPKSMADDPSVPGQVMDRGRVVGPEDGGFRQTPWTKAPAQAPTEVGVTAGERPRSNDQARGPSRKVGDALMDRFYGKGAVGGGPAMQMPGAAGGSGRGTLDIRLHGFPAGAQARASMDDLFKETSVSKGQSQMSMDRA